MGIGAWCYSLDKLGDSLNLRVIDMLGMGRSSRPKFTATCVNDSESFFVESLEQWRKSVGLKKFILAGHSFGGYMSVAYAEKYPQHVEKVFDRLPLSF